MNAIWTDIAFWFFSIAAIWFGWKVFRADSMVRASFALLASFLNVAAVMILLLAEYLGVALFFMMAVEMTVMALFMVGFMMNPAGLNPMMMVHQHALSILFGVVGGAVLTAVALIGDFPLREMGTAADRIDQLGSEVLGDSMLIFETAGIALLATMLGAIILSSRSSRFNTMADNGSRPPPLDPNDPDSVPDLAQKEDHEGHNHHH